MSERRPSSPSAARLGRAFLVLLVLPACACGPHSSDRALSGDEIDLVIGGHKVRVEVASDDLSRQTGLMHRESLPESRGMLFIYRSAHELSFWMKNTSIPLEIAFLDDAGKILEIRRLRPRDESSVTSRDPVRYALEVNDGWFRKRGLKAGDSFDEFEAKVQTFHVR